jgi:hypothetical protein
MDTLNRYLRLKTGIRALALLAFGILLVGCEEDPSPTPKPEPQHNQTPNCDGQQVLSETLKKGERSNYESDENLVITSQNQWQDLWQAMDMNETCPVVNFNTHFVIGAFQGTKPSGGHRIGIQQLCIQNGRLTTTIQNTVPGEGCGVTQEVLNPYHLVKVKKSSMPQPLSKLNVSFKEATNETCGSSEDEHDPKGQVVTFKELYTSGVSNAVEAKQYVIRSESAYKNVWQQKVLTPTIYVKRPEVDFSKNMVIAVFQGKKPTGGHQVRVDSAVKSHNSLHVDVLHKRPGKACEVYQAFTKPCQFVTVPKMKDKVNFDVQNVTRQCGN